jgi:hypothetical protein
VAAEKEQDILPLAFPEHLRLAVVAAVVVMVHILQVEQVGLA